MNYFVQEPTVEPSQPLLPSKTPPYPPPYQPPPSRTAEAQDGENVELRKTLASLENFLQQNYDSSFGSSNGPAQLDAEPGIEDTRENNNPQDHNQDVVDINRRPFPRRSETESAEEDDVFADQENPQIHISLSDFDTARESDI